MTTAFEPETREGQFEQVCLAEIDRLDQVLSRWRADSELARYNAGCLMPSGDLAYVLDEAERWRRASDGVFDPGRPPYVDLDAIAKGYIVDRAARAAYDAGATRVVVNIGGDLAHLGSGSLTVRIEDPRTPYDNAPPLARVPISNQGLATSGIARRGQHIRDPRTGRPASRTLSATVVADACATADALATIVGILEPEQGIRLIERYGAACLIVTVDRVWMTSTGSAAWSGVNV